MQQEQEITETAQAEKALLMQEIVQLNSRTIESNKSAIKELEEALDMARSGTLLSVGICAVLTENRVYETAAGGADTAALLGVSVLLTDRIKAWLVD